MRLKRNFFNRDTNIVAQELLGCRIVRVLDDPLRLSDSEASGSRIEAIITETEAYHGFEDKASHASRKKTPRNKVMFDHAGLVYVYLIYGMHHCLNFVTLGKDFPAAVLVRSIAIKSPKITKLKIKNSDNQTFTGVSGPGRVTKLLKVSKELYGEDLTTSKKIWIESVGAGFSRPKIIKSKRIGVDYAGECAEWEWNYKILLT